MSATSTLGTKRNHPSSHPIKRWALLITGHRPIHLVSAPLFFRSWHQKKQRDLFHSALTDGIVLGVIESCMA